MKGHAQVGPDDVLAVIARSADQRPGRAGKVGCGDDELGELSASTVRRRPSSVSCFSRSCRVRGNVLANPVPGGLPTRRERSRPRQGVPLARTTRTLPRVLTPEQVDALMAALRTDRELAMVTAMVLGGLRRCEVLGLASDDVRAEARLVFIVHGKGGHQRLARSLPGSPPPWVQGESGA